MAAVTDAAGNPWFSWDYVQSNASALLSALIQHVELTAASVLIAAVLAIPLGILAYRVSWLTGPILALSSVLYTIPSLGLFAVLAPFLGLYASTVVIGLVLYALLVIVRNTLTGLNQVPVEIRDAARGMGYGRLGLLTRIELPLSLPSIMTGLRIATVSTVAMVTVGSVVGGYGGFGELILEGFRNNFYKAQIMTATIATVLLALVFDLVLALLGRLATPWSRRRSA
ncbi:glycine/betaine ABC transporter permease [Actinocatenispora thailandica]|uniref:Glycine/betaine ABC transporter permease n=1 Tax=Actinocatenispora thailandica TaxID=227318 RepID=A0A7R7DJF6_9ACTN|nr:glycine/betaine ABC transporter permease [Actinocatenispora thailandica]